MILYVATPHFEQIVNLNYVKGAVPRHKAEEPKTLWEVHLLYDKGGSVVVHEGTQQSCVNFISTIFMKSKNNEHIIIDGTNFG